MSNISYNPSVDIPPYHGFSDNNGPKVMDFPSDGNFRSGRQQEIPYSGDVRYDTPQIDPRIENHSDIRMDYRIDPRVDYHGDNRGDYRMPPRMDNQHTERFIQPRRNKRKREYMADETSNQTFNWILFAKKIVIFTILFLVFNHMKTHELFCGLLPFLNKNELLCITVKGLVYSLIILLLLGTFLR